MHFFEFIYYIFFDRLLVLFGDENMVIAFFFLAYLTIAVFVCALTVVFEQLIAHVVWRLNARRKANIRHEPMLVANNVVVAPRGIVQHRSPLPHLPIEQVADHPCDDGDDESIAWSFVDDDDDDEDSLAYSASDGTNEYYISSDEEDGNEESLEEESIGDDAYDNNKNSNEELIVPANDHMISIPLVIELAADIPPPVAVEAPLRRSSRNRRKPVRFVDEYERYY